MKCLICVSEFSVKRTVLTLFRTKPYYICNACLKANPFNVEFNYFPLDNHMLEVVSLFKDARFLNFNAFKEEYSRIYESLTEFQNNKYVICTDILKVTEEKLTEFEQLSKKYSKDILVLTYILEI